jgi:hypothetical protein
VRALPEKHRGKKRFSKPREVLRWQLRLLQTSSRRHLHFKEMPDEEQEIFAGAMTMMRAAAANGKAILAAIQYGVAEAGYPLLRSILELWANSSILLRDKTPRTVRLMYVSGSLALLGHKYAQGPEADQVVAQLRKTFPEEFKIAEERRKKGKYKHWSGRGWKEVIIAECGEANGLLYEGLSWDSHAILQIVLDVNKNAGPHLQTRHRSPQADVERDVSIATVVILRTMWNSLAARFSKYSV